MQTDAGINRCWDFLNPLLILKPRSDKEGGPELKIWPQVFAGGIIPFMPQIDPQSGANPQSYGLVGVIPFRLEKYPQPNANPQY